MVSIEATVRGLLPHTWHAFFGRFGRLTPIQGQAVPPIAGGQSVLVVAPTASGKTEAVVAPLLERVYDHGRGALSVLLISPTRALSNDLRRRLHNPVIRCGLNIDVKTGDASSFNDEAPPELLVTTPESLDSMLCRRPKSLRQVQAVMIDELHLIGSSPRGDQLRALLSRLDKVSAHGPTQRVAASATIPDMEGLAARFLGPSAVSIEAHTDAGAQRRIEAELVAASTIEEAVAAIGALYGAAPRRKLLVFANTRAQVEELTGALSAIERLRGRVYAHHGSLARGERLRVERAFQESPTAICVATLTLEIGVDIGGVDRVVLLSPPPNVASLLQRVGRSNRREQITHVLCLHNGDFERDRFEHMLDCAARGRLFEDKVPFRPSVLAQQALSLLFQNPARWVTAEALRARLPEDVARRYSISDLNEMLARMHSQELLREGPYKRSLPDERASRAFETGRIHTNLNDAREVEVVDQLTGRAVGRVRLRKGDRDAASRGDLSLALGGQQRQVTRVQGDRVVVRSVEGLGGSGRFIGREAPRYSFGLAQSLARWLEIPPETLIIEEPADEDWRLVHFWGTVWGRLLEAVLRVSRGRQISAKSHPFVSPLLPGLFPDEGVGLGTPEALRGWTRVALEGDLIGFARLLEPGPMMEVIPRDLLLRWVFEAVDIDRFIALASTVRVIRGANVTPPPADPEPAPARPSFVGPDGTYQPASWVELALEPGESLRGGSPRTSAASE